MKEQLYIGVMSGTSMDGVDAALISISETNIETNIETKAFHHEELTNDLRKQIVALCTPGDNEIERSRTLDVTFGLLIAETVNTLLAKSGHKPQEIQAIGSHGQTIRHRPDSAVPFSLQIGNPSVIAEKTGITTVADFRMADIAAGGEGAPLVPAFHRAAFGNSKAPRTIINIGGISNITAIDSEIDQPTYGYDIGPGNTLLDAWIELSLDKRFDNNGEWARSGKLIPELLKLLNEDPYIQKQPPKSTGREYFNLDWLQKKLIQLSALKAQDIQHTLTEFTAQSIAKDIKSTNCSEAFICGGGVNNNFLIERITQLLPALDIGTTNELGIDAQQVEAAAFGWLAHQTINRLTGNLTTVTGASKTKILGGIYFP